VAKAPSPLVGFNNNVKHLGRIFHVQTEDSGVSRPHVVTHLFADGGRIIKSTRTDYSEHVGRSDMGTVVRRLMKEQHKAMFIALRDGQLNETIERICGVPADVPVIEERRPSVPPEKRLVKPEPTLSGLPRPTPDGAAPVDPTLPVPRKPAPTLTDLVLADLEAARARGPQGEEGTRPGPGVKGGTPHLGTPAIPTRPGPVRTASGRYAAPRPAAIFTTEPEQGSSIFGGSSISEQSLDEVILSYLAEDLDGSAEK
jgi:hypothetical protein